ncbi:YafY family protein [Amaricoccus sp.]|uniref:helix-turn-helix transcriptional regulator n=1 Tax=Amaricoccus sp. TaxID=1872485 RepID=UPI001B6866CA|nr:YafY family protein [Amaricoccus sp.]MBP7243488.1 YafY family transcriptional regulator [Amaricoccus sp.]
MGSPTNRILAVLELLQAHGQLAGTEIARRLGVDRRTVRRYIVALEEMGIPVTAERGAGGGYALVAGFKLPPMLFTDDEALALSLGLHAASALGLGDPGGHSAGLASARSKLERVMPADLKRRLRAADETMQLDLPASGPPAESQVLATLSAAAQAQRTVHVTYEAADKSRTARDLDPYGLAFRGGCWYVVGHCHLRKGPRTFRVDRIATTTRTTRTFERPANFDTLAAISTAIATLPRAHQAEVLLHTDLATAKKQIFATLGTLEEVEGGVLLHSQTDDLPWLARELARLPFGFAVRQPDALRAAIHTHSERLRRAAAPPRRPRQRPSL